MTTFVVRIHSSQLPSHDGSDLHGIVDEVASGARAKFQDSAELMAILRQSGEPAGVPSWGEK